jgi:hypothetical protein
MSATSKRLCGNIKLPKFFHAFLVGAFAMGAVVINAPAMATTITDHITFSITGAYGVPPITTDHGYTNATISGSFDINFDPIVQILPSQSITGVISNLNVSVTDPYFSPPNLTFSPIQFYAFDGAGTLTLSSDPALSKALVDVPFLTVGINGWAYGTASAVWYSQNEFGDTLTGSGSATITELGVGGLQSETPLPAALPLFATGLGGLGLLGWRRKRKAKVAAAIAA